MIKHDRAHGHTWRARWYRKEKTTEILKCGQLESPATRRSFESPLVLNSALRGQPAFEWLIAPTTIAQFYNEHLERAPLLRKHGSRLFATLLSMTDFERVVRARACQYDRDLDVTSYAEACGRRTHNGARSTAAG